MDPHQRKIELQSPADLDYLTSNIQEIAQKKVDLHVPPSIETESINDTFRTTVNELVHQYVQETLDLALPSISINGLDATPSNLSSLTRTDSDNDVSTPAGPDDAAYEPYDQRLANQLRDLYAALETETTKVAQMRRDAPARAAQLYLDHLHRDLELHKTDYQAHQKALESEAETGFTGLDKVKLDRQNRVESVWKEATGNLERLRGVTEAVALLERAKIAAEEVGALK